MEIEEFTAGQPLRVGDITLVPIIRTFVSCAGVETGVVVHGSRSPTSIVVVSKEDKYAMNLTGKRMPIDQYLQQVPGLAEVLERL
ncbi:hypothetical protein ACFLX9_02290 [Chloroflexota bacterium]